MKILPEIDNIHVNTLLRASRSTEQRVLLCFNNNQTKNIRMKLTLQRKHEKKELGMKKIKGE